MSVSPAPRPCCDKVSCSKFWSDLGTYMLQGLGMFTNAYTMLAVGNIEHLLAHAEPQCWGNQQPSVCTTALRNSVRYTVFVGIFVGMVVGGFLGDIYGRRKGSITTAAIMLIGSVLIVCSSGPTAQAQWTWYTLSLMVFGVGVGGEFPMSAAVTAEKAEAERQEAERKRQELTIGIEGDNNSSETPDRGKKVLLSFQMQGMGNWANCLVIVLLLMFAGQTSSIYDANKLGLIWRVQYLIGSFVLVMLLFYRIRYLQESSAWLELIKAQRRFHYRLFFRCYWHRLTGTALSWFVWDLAFYGNRIFQAQFIAMFAPNVNVFTEMKLALLNSTIAWIGLLIAAYTVDKYWMGRRRMQVMGFAAMFLMFAIGAIFLKKLRSPEGLIWLQILYYLTTFYGQWGPNATTFAFPSEVFPTQSRALAHGISGAAGKLGALLAAISFTYFGGEVRFVVCSLCGLIGLFVTIVFLPEITTLPITENDVFWNAVIHSSMEGSPLSAEEHGVSVFSRSNALAHYEGPYLYKDSLSLYEQTCGHRTLHELIQPALLSSRDEVEVPLQERIE